MGPSKAQNGENMPRKGSSFDDYDRTETLPSDSQIPTSQISGEKDSDVDEVLQDTLPFDYTFVVEDEFETQEVKLAEETLEMDLCCETQVQNIDDKTEVDDFGCETQVLNDVDCVEHPGTQLLDVCDSEDEGTNGTEPLCDNEEPSVDELVRIDGGISVSEENILGSSLGSHQAKGLKEPLDPLSDDQKKSGKMLYTSFRTTSFRANALAARVKALKCAKGESCSIPTDGKPSKQYSGKDSAPSLLKLGQGINQERILWRDNEIAKSARNENSGKVSSSAMRKLFADDSDAGDKELSYDNNICHGGENLTVLPACDLAGLSYVESQEPGDLSQANALGFVDRFLKDKELEFGNEDGSKIARGDSKNISSAKSLQRLAKKANDTSIIGEKCIYDWDDSREDEGGGDIFCRRKEEFLSGGSYGQRGKKSKANRLEVPNGHNQSRFNKIMGMADSDSRVMSHNHADIQVKRKSKKNLANALEKQSDIDSMVMELQANARKTGAPPMADVGFDTQMAANAMEALFCSEEVSNGHVSDAYKGTQKDSYSSPKAPSGGNINIGCSDHPPSQKRTCHNDIRFASMKSKKARKIDANSKKASLVSSGKMPKSVVKQHQKVLPVETKAKSTGKEHIKNDERENFKVSVNKRQRQVRVGNLNCIAHRTRRSLVENTSSSCREEMNQLTDVFNGNKSNGTKEVQASKMLRRAKVENMKLNQCDRLDKIMDANPNVNGIDTLSYSRGRSVRELSCQVNGSHHVDGPSESIQPEEDEQCITRQRRSSRKTRSSTCGSSVKTPVDQNLLGKMSEQRLVSGDAKSAEISTRLDELPNEKLKPSYSSCATPVSHQGPVCDASPVCMGDEYFSQTCKRAQSMPYLLKEVCSLSAQGSKPTTPSKDLRKRRDMTEVCVLYSQHLDVDIVKHQKKILARLGISLVYCITNATHFIADQFVRTRNMLEAIASGKPVVTHLWLESCGQANCFIDEKSYILRDAKMEKEFGFNMLTSLSHACQRPLLKGCRVFVTPNTKPSKETTLSLVKAVQGQPIERFGRSLLKEDKVPDDLLVLSCEEDYAMCLPFLEKGAAIYSSELLLNGIVTQKLEYERHQIFADNVKKTRSTIWLRNESNKFMRIVKNR